MATAILSPEARRLRDTLMCQRNLAADPSGALAARTAAAVVNEWKEQLATVAEALSLSLATAQQLHADADNNESYSYYAGQAHGLRQALNAVAALIGEL